MVGRMANSASVMAKSKLFSDELVDFSQRGFSQLSPCLSHAGVPLNKLCNGAQEVVQQRCNKGTLRSRNPSRLWLPSRCAVVTVPRERERVNEDSRRPE